MSRREIRRIGIVSVMHCMIDFLCAFAVYGTFRYRYDPFRVYLYYSFFAFAVQMPLGILLDRIIGEGRVSKDLPPFWFTTAGILVTLLGTITNPVILGIGNALFHTGGGVTSIQEDDRAGLRGRGLGVFVAPGAIGLFLGGQISNVGKGIVLGCSALVLAALWLTLYRNMQGSEPEYASMPEFVFERKGVIPAVLACFAVVVIRSAVGTAVSFSWKNGFALSFLATIMLAVGKSAGGFAGARFGIRRTALVSLVGAAVCYFFKDILPFGLAALFLFNMSMPLTLYLLAKRMPGMPGLAFGLLTFALYLGFVLIYTSPVSIPLIGPLGSLVSAVLLAYAAGESDAG